MTRHTNRLIHETSPYLLQHAHNPVDWHPWGEEAFALARSEDKPVFLSIGYSACHWCHVMERESFENEATAELLNAAFVSIKVDREERPDVDSIYMQAVQTMSGHGGWPMSMFLTPDGEPFFGGTYFPPQDQHGMAGFPSVLRQLSSAWRERRGDITRAATEMRAILNARPSAIAAPLDGQSLETMVSRLATNFDSINGGFGGAPKFPPAMTLEFLLHMARSTNDDEASSIVDLTLRKMAGGGIYDQVGGGFHRYSVDARWLAPHFEKMLYDNALLTRLYVRAWQRSHDPLFKRIAIETLGFIEREMTSPDGGFYSTLDADSEGVEGRFYVWSEAEVIATLGEVDGPLFCALYDITPHGNWEETNIANMPRPLEAVAKERGVTAEELEAVASRGKCKLFGARSARVRPARDEKILAGWNGWMLAAVSEAALAFGRDADRRLVRSNAEFLATTMWDGTRLWRSFKDGQRKIGGLLEDYAGVALGLIAAFEALQERSWLDLARQLADQIIARFSDEDGGFFDTPHDHEALIARPKDVMDNATPAGNSVACHVLLKLSLYFDEPNYRLLAERCIATSSGLALRYPSAFGYLLCAAAAVNFGTKEIVITGSGDARDELLRTVGETYVPSRILVTSSQPDLPLLQGRDAARIAAYVCEHYSCQQPAESAVELRAQLER